MAETTINWTSGTKTEHEVLNRYCSDYKLDRDEQAKLTDAEKEVLRNQFTGIVFDGKNEISLLKWLDNSENEAPVKHDPLADLSMEEGLYLDPRSAKTLRVNRIVNRSLAGAVIGGVIFRACKNLGGRLSLGSTILGALVGAIVAGVSTYKAEREKQIAVLEKVRAMSVEQQASEENEEDNLVAYNQSTDETLPCIDPLEQTVAPITTPEIEETEEAPEAEKAEEAKDAKEAEEAKKKDEKELEDK